MPSDLLLAPFVAGLLVTFALAMAGVGLFLRGSVWQALALGQWAAVGGVLASVMHWPVLPVALGLGAGLMALLKRSRDKERLPLAAFLAGLAVITLLAANFAQASLAAAAWAEGQLYFAGAMELQASAALGVASLLLGPGLYRVWRNAQLLPDVSAAPPPSAWLRWTETAWLVATIVLGSMVLGLPAALASLLLPAWGAAYLVRDLRGFVLWTQGMAITGFLMAWSVSLPLDQPFAPMLVLVNTGLLVGARLFALSRD
ncbi:MULTISPECIES: ABC transporter [unclassified Ectothiorhodospira]|uniref:ABC transporter n=1 Tax=unclassified Ectothiorhodospira TaxID=2684909 RepID=UPI001EE7D1F3|nr:MULTISPECIES: ABC transporter [unclassified Ectothiorhodospira]MCG5514944.1 ABC transporter [Ectothiorhodospira sp. 9100]MCG5517731.1 ABC transporter [Ectothiorhodospira sp. 9905]